MKSTPQPRIRFDLGWAWVVLRQSADREMSEINVQLELLKPYITAEVQELVRYRLLEGGRFSVQRRLLPEYKASDVKLVLLLVRLANPAEQLDDEEELLVSRGIGAVLGKRKGARGERMATD
jgi:hypothetical protein